MVAEVAVEIQMKEVEILESMEPMGLVLVELIMLHIHIMVRLIRAVVVVVHEVVELVMVNMVLVPEVVELFLCGG